MKMQQNKMMVARLHAAGTRIKRNNWKKHFAQFRKDMAKIGVGAERLARAFQEMINRIHQLKAACKPRPNFPLAIVGVGKPEVICMINGTQVPVPKGLVMDFNINPYTVKFPLPSPIDVSKLKTFDDGKEEPM